MNRPKDWDIVDEASWESFPASDPPGWGSFRAAPSASTCGDRSESSLRSPRRIAARRGAALWIGAGVALFVPIVVGIVRRLRAA